jgi:hypothetical protein
VRVLELGRRAGLAQETLDPARAVEGLRLGHLDRNLPVELLVISPVDPPERPLAEELADQESGDALGQIGIGTGVEGGGLPGRSIGGVASERAIAIVPGGDVVCRLLGRSVLLRMAGSDRRPGRGWRRRSACEGRFPLVAARVEKRLLFRFTACEGRFRGQCPTRTGVGRRRLDNACRLAGPFDRVPAARAGETRFRLTSFEPHHAATAWAVAARHRIHGPYPQEIKRGLVPHVEVAGSEELRLTDLVISKNE